jgi:DNA-nicking Smr family endonuclease
MNREEENVAKVSSNRSKKITQKKELLFKSDETDIYVPDTPWVHLKPYLDNLIRLTVEDPLCEERTIHFKRLGQDSEDYFAWKDDLQSRSRYPVSIGSGNEGAEGIKVDGKYEKYNSFLHISNYVKKEKEVREFPYKRFGGHFDESQVNLRTFYNLMARAVFKEDDFAKGKYGYQDQIYVKPVYLKNKILDECALEMKENILSTLQRVTQPYVTFILELAKDVPYTFEELKAYGGRGSFFHEIEPLSKIVEQEENRIYIVYYNEKKSTLDLHELALNEAKEKVASFIKEKYDNFETEGTIITGRGNHINSNGTSGVLNQMLPTWVRSSELQPYIKDINLCNGGGLYKVKLIEPVHITLTSNDFNEDVGKVFYFISKENEKGRNRLKIIHENHPSGYIDKVIMEVMLRSSKIPSFPKSYHYGMIPSAHHLMWNQQESAAQENLGIQFIVNGQGQKKIQLKQDNVQKKNKQKTIKTSLGNNKDTTNNGTIVSNPSYMAYIKQIGLRKPISLSNSTVEENVPIVEALIQSVIERKIETPVMVHVSLPPTELPDFREAFSTLVNRYPSPFTWSMGNKGYRNQGTDHPTCLLELSLVSHAKKRERLQVRSIYQISQEDEKKVNWPYVVDVAMRSNFTSEDLTFKNSIKVRLLNLQGKSEERILEEFYQFLEQRLLKDNNPFHILGITFNSKIKENTGSMLGGFLKKVSEVQVGLSSRGTVFDPPNGSLYICLDNTQRKRLDLHAKRLTPIGYDGKSVKEADQETQDFIMQAYETFKEDITVLTGRGNHVNFDGSKGVLKAAFGDLMKDERFFPLIKNYFLLEGEGGYKVSFVPICDLNLHTNQKNNLSCIGNTIAQMIEQNKKRLRITLNPEKGVQTPNREFNFMLSIYADLQKNNEQLAKSILPLSFESTPGEMKVIFNKQHPKSPSSFTFADSFGSTSVFGTIR